MSAPLFGTIEAIGAYGVIAVACDATQEQVQAVRHLVGVHRGIVVIAAAAPPHGSPLDYLHELKGALLSLTDTHDTQADNERHRALRRCLSLANTAHLAILAERARR